MKLFLYYFKVFFISLWVAGCSLVGLFFVLAQWGNPNLFSTWARRIAWGMTKISGICIETEGLENIPKGSSCIYVANHQSAMDIATIGTILPERTVVIGKKEIMNVPLLGLIFVACGGIIIDRSNPKEAIASLDAAVKKMSEKNLSLIMMPEGTRNRTGVGLLPFKKGAFHLAIKAQIPIVPIVCSSLRNVANFATKTLKRGTVKIKMLPPVSTKGLTANDVDQLSKSIRDKMLKEFEAL